VPSEPIRPVICTSPTNPPHMSWRMWYVTLTLTFALLLYGLLLFSSNDSGNTTSRSYDVNTVMTVFNGVTEQDTWQAGSGPLSSQQAMRRKTCINTQCTKCDLKGTRGVWQAACLPHTSKRIASTECNHVGNLRADEMIIWTLWSQSSSRYYIRIQSVPQRKHSTSPLQSSAA
jgi:hypothetical protein